MTMKRIAAAAGSLLLLAACSAGPSASPSPTPTVVDEWSARIQLLAHYDVFWCDPDAYPVGVDANEVMVRARAWYRANGDTPEARAIVSHRGFTPPLTDEQILTVYSDHKEFPAIAIRSDGGVFTFELVDGDEADAQRVTGTIDARGAITETARVATVASCPICLQPGTLIATSRGPIDVVDLRVGDAVWTRDRAGRRVVRPLIQVVRRATPAAHAMIRVRLSDGRTLIAAPQHPRADGTPLGAIRAGDRFDGSTVSSVDLITSRARATFDILPAGPTGLYEANGILLASTLRR